MPRTWASSTEWSAMYSPKLLEPGSGARTRSASSRSGLRRALLVIGPRPGRGVGKGRGHRRHPLGEHGLERGQVTTVPGGQSLDVPGDCEGVQAARNAKEIEPERLESPPLGEGCGTENATVDLHV